MKFKVREGLRLGTIRFPEAALLKNPGHFKKCIKKNTMYYVFSPNRHEQAQVIDKSRDRIARMGKNAYTRGWQVDPRSIVAEWLYLRHSASIREDEKMQWVRDWKLGKFLSMGQSFLKNESNCSSESKNVCLIEVKKIAPSRYCDRALTRQLKYLITCLVSQNLFQFFHVLYIYWQRFSTNATSFKTTLTC